MTLHLNDASRQAIEHTYLPLANALQSRLDAVTFRMGAVIGVLRHEIETSDHGTGTIASEEQEVLREHARQLVLEAEALAEAVWELTGEIGQLPLSDARELEQAPRHKAALEELGMLDAFGGASALVDATVDVEQLPPTRCPIMELRRDGFLRCVLPDGHSLGPNATEHAYNAEISNEASLDEIAARPRGCPAQRVRDGEIIDVEIVEDHDG